MSGVIFGPDDDDGLEAAWKADKVADLLAQFEALRGTPSPTGDGGDEAE